VDWLDPFERDEGDVPAPDGVVVGVVEAYPVTASYSGDSTFSSGNSNSRTITAR